MYIDTHSHLYLDAFGEDREQVIDRARKAGVEKILLPNIDSRSAAAMFAMAGDFPGICHPMAGLHPTSVKTNFREELAEVEKLLDRPDICGIGECGIDLYWDKSFQAEQVAVFEQHILWARQLDLPLVIHARESFKEIFEVMDRVNTDGLMGVFHSFTGGPAELEKALGYGFMIGINGIVTFKNSGLRELVGKIPPECILLETDAPFLAPHPHRGKRNESSYLPLIAIEVARSYDIPPEELGELSTNNACRLFKRIQLNGK